MLFNPRLAALVLLALLPLSGRGAAPPPQRHTGLVATLRALEADIAAVRGLRFKRRVEARIIARPQGAPGGIQGYYSPKEKVLYLYDDVRGNYRRGVLIHE